MVILRLLIFIFTKFPMIIGLNYKSTHILDFSHPKTMLSHQVPKFVRG